MRFIWPLLKRTFREFADDNCSQLAAAISYYVLFSIIPLAIFLTSLFGFVVRDSDIQDEVIERLVDTLPVEEGEGRDLVTDTVRGVSRVSGALTLVGVIGMAWSASAMFGAIRKALNIAWDTEVHRPLVQQKLIDLEMVVGVGLLLGASIAGTTALRTLRELSDEALGPLSTGTGFFWSVLPLALPGFLTFLVFLLIYRFVPNVSHRLGDVWPGALLATALFELLKNAFVLYVAEFSNYDVVYGSLGAVMLFLLWTYLSANVLLLGAELASEYERAQAGRHPITPAAAEGLSLNERLVRTVRGLFVHDREHAEGRRVTKGR